MPPGSKGAGRGPRATCRRCLLAGSLLAGIAGGLMDPAHAGQAGLGRPSGLPWPSGVNGKSNENYSFSTWRGGRKLDVRTIFFGITSWSHMASSAGSLSTAVNGGSGRLVVALGMLPTSHVGQLSQCASGLFDPQIRAVASGMLTNGAQAAADNGRPVVLRLGWEANNTEGGYPWRATGDGTSWRDCFRRWVDILNPVTNATTSPPMRQKNFLIVWNMANAGTFPHKIEKLWPGNDVVDVVGTQFYDRCPPMTTDAEFKARMSPKDRWGNPAGPQAWLDWAKARGKRWALPDWGIGGSKTACARPGIDNPFFVQKMHEFLRANASQVAFESYFNGADSHTGTHALYPTVHNPKAAAAYQRLW